MSGTTEGRADLVVVGAGTMGAWTALWARRSGRSTMLVDAYGAGHPRATSGDENRIIRNSHGTDSFYARWARRAREQWIALGEQVAEQIFFQAGVLWFAARPDGFEADAYRTLASLDIPVEHLSPKEVVARWPQVGLDSLSFALFEPEAGFLLARRGVAAAARQFCREGGTFRLADVRPGRADGHRLLDVVDGSGGRIAAGTFVFACGPWLPGLFPEAVGSLIKVTKQDVIYIGPPAGDGRFHSDELPAWVDYDEAFWGVPAHEERGFKIGADREGPPFDPGSEDRIVDPSSIDAVRRYLALRFPALTEQPVVETRVCQYETTPDTHFLIDRHPDWDNVWLVGGGSGHGFKHGPAIGEYVVGRLDGQAVGPDEERFALREREPQAGMRTGGHQPART
jgi:sarcosine oxidase